MNKGLLAVIVVLILVGLFVFVGPSEAPIVEVPGEQQNGEVLEQAKFSIENGEYAVVAEKSQLKWAGKKPLVDGYINSGTIDVTEGEVSVSDDQKSGTFTIDINTLSVSETKAKPGAESALEEHLKGDGWFNVEEFGTATFEITEISETEDVETSFMYTVSGTLTMKGVTEEVAFPAEVYVDENGDLVAVASFEIDRTLWGITAGSGSFFDDLGDRVISDMIAISFRLVATEGTEVEE
jgi:polyisoprenoid-binding protein YceI